MNTIDEWLRERIPAGEDLTRPQLAELVQALGRERGLWEELVRHDENERYFLQLYRDMHLDVWLICWLNAQDTGYHDHDLSGGAVCVCDGMLYEDCFQRGADGWVREITRERPAGSVFDFDSAYIHGLRHASGPPATSIHGYSPALWRMGYYLPDEEGLLRRTPITYADEMGSGVAA